MAKTSARQALRFDQVRHLGAQLTQQAQALCKQFLEAVFDAAGGDGRCAVAKR